MSQSLEDCPEDQPSFAHPYGVPSGVCFRRFFNFFLCHPANRLHPLSLVLESDPADLEELLGGVLVPWVRKKLKGKAPPEVCRWLLGLVTQHDVSPVVTAAEDALLQLLAEDGQARDRATLC